MHHSKASDYESNKNNHWITPEIKTVLMNRDKVKGKTVISNDTDYWLHFKLARNKCINMLKGAKEITITGYLQPAREIPSDAKDNVGNYRPISVLSVISKVSERIVFVQIYTYFNENHLLHKNKLGVKKCHSTMTALIDDTIEWLANMDQGKLTAIVYIDLANAFDTISHERLLEKLHTCRVDTNNLYWFQSYLQDRTQKCYVNDALSAGRTIHCGVSQGSILEPLLYVIRIQIKICPSGISVSDGKWHHVCITWQSSDGAVQAYKDGALIKSLIGYTPGRSILPFGIWIIGQDQDSLGGGFQLRDAFDGYLIDVNVWDRVLFAGEISFLANRECGSGMKGNYRAYNDFVPYGGVRKYKLNNNCKSLGFYFRFGRL
ncbi:Hypothetical predicted protein [Paramuricea clavata]|uniref:Pentraxin (PTX) domain-containing protein n=1 Tax=Paramuricea clavata TaxID=317549 RepID=A0A7D9L5S6_PARCT|nr:Hypothetical predicted protein [Paramuricea clavata]